eukprot:617309-Pyramimonas_sp.AAC.2
MSKAGPQRSTFPDRGAGAQRPTVCCDRLIHRTGFTLCHMCCADPLDVCLNQVALCVAPPTSSPRLRSRHPAKVIHATVSAI